MRLKEWKESGDNEMRYAHDLKLRQKRLYVGRFECNDETGESRGDVTAFLEDGLFTYFAVRDAFEAVRKVCE